MASMIRKIFDLFKKTEEPKLPVTHEYPDSPVVAPKLKHSRKRGIGITRAPSTKRPKGRAHMLHSANGHPVHPEAK